MRFLAVRLRIAVAMLVLGGVACGDGGEGSGDDEVDGGSDAGQADGGVDGGVTCAPACLTPDVCCPEAPGGDVGLCVDTRTDLAHCGGCNVVCGDRFTACSGGRCICGATPCLTPNECCPGPTPESPPRCRSLDTEEDCGACGNVCDPVTAPLCIGGGCACASEEGPCDGEAGETCCFETVPPLPGSRRLCVDLDVDPEHCGECGRRCPPGASCVGGTCSFGSTPCATECLAEQVCCNGACCLDRQCDGETCDFSRGP